MIDMHNHLLFNIDDGCKDISESINAIKKMISIGFDSIVLTPHYIKDSSFNANNEIKKERLYDLNNKLKQENIDINLFLGNEIFINEEIDELVINKKIRSINNSRYLLIELPFNNKIVNLEDYIYELKLKGYKVIIAHPERYTYFQNDYKLVKELYEEGVYFQSNYGSIIGQYGSSSKKLIKKLLKDDMISFLSTDVHKDNSSLFDDFKTIKNKIIKIIGLDKFNEITNYNIKKVIEDKDI